MHLSVLFLISLVTGPVPAPNSMQTSTRRSIWLTIPLASAFDDGVIDPILVGFKRNSMKNFSFARPNTRAVTSKRLIKIIAMCFAVSMSRIIHDRVKAVRRCCTGISHETLVS